MPAVPLESRLLQALAPWREAGAGAWRFPAGWIPRCCCICSPSWPRRSLAGAVGAACPPWLAGCGGRLAGALPGGLPVAGYPAAGRAGAGRRWRQHRAGGARRPLSRIPGEPGRGQVLLTAQHLDDQAETLLFRLLRGAGLRGLAAMPASRRCSGFPAPNWKPMRRRTGWTGWRILPTRIRASRATTCAGRSCRVSPPTGRRPSPAWRARAHLREAEDLLAELAAIDLRACRQPSELDWPDWLDLPRIALEPLRRLSAARQRLLRAWLGQLTRLPDSDHWAGWESLRDAGDDADPIWRLESGELRRGGADLVVAGGLACSGGTVRLGASRSSIASSRQWSAGVARRGSGGAVARRLPAGWGGAGPGRARSPRPQAIAQRSGRTELPARSFAAALPSRRTARGGQHSWPGQSPRGWRLSWSRRTTRV